MKNQILSQLACMLYFISALNPLYAQLVAEKVKDVKQPLILKTNEKTLRIIVDEKEQRAPWVINPSIRPDIFQTSAKKVTFRSRIDSISFDIPQNSCYDFS